MIKSPAIIRANDFSNSKALQIGQLGMVSGIVVLCILAEEAMFYTCMDTHSVISRRWISGRKTSVIIKEPMLVRIHCEEKLAGRLAVILGRSGPSRWEFGIRSQIVLQYYSYG